MDRDGALARLTMLGGAEQRPTLSAAELGLILDDSRTVDANGRRVSDPLYVESWNMNYACRKAWEAKAAKVAGDFSFQADGASYSKGDVMANIEKMITLYRNKDVGIMTVETDREDGLVAGLRLEVNGHS